jgi:hypothetical protein
MKTLFYTFLMVFGLGSVSLAQDSNGIAVAPTKSEIAKGKESGSFKFVMPEGTTIEDVTQSAKYYTHYFTVDYDSATRSAKIKMVSNDEKSRSVIVRFLVSNNVQTVDVEGSMVSVYDFFEKYLK